MIYDLDQYYTPTSVAERVLGDYVLTTPKSCVDSTCGTGCLLQAATNVFGDIHCIGLDRNKKVITDLRRSNPSWILSVGDMLKPKSYQQTKAITSNFKKDLLILNPPFSHGNHKSIEVIYKSSLLKCSVAMAHILQSFNIFKPQQGAIVIAPESVLYSDTDKIARKLLSQDYRIEIIKELENTTFRGARAHATVIKITPCQGNCLYEADKNQNFKCKDLKVIRGALPVHQMKRSSRGVPFIHTTNLRDFTHYKTLPNLSRTNITRKGRIAGWVILIPRVGLPIQNSVKSLFLQQEVQLSDCVIGLQFRKQSQALRYQQIFEKHWNNFLTLYRGTGARYITIARLETWLSRVSTTDN
ncbi:MAG: N-6 DNA methylase [Candidatus Thiodiazotropha endolucinida]|nr:N-6 DNA methylase [Candidatus Thiodiazotropha taylori]MCW4312491.1 N-6 DNA methylase [Candidatus Thiodiazotropha taylori]